MGVSCRCSATGANSCPLRDERYKRRAYFWGVKFIRLEGSLLGVHGVQRGRVLYRFGLGLSNVKALKDLSPITP